MPVRRQKKTRKHRRCSWVYYAKKKKQEMRKICKWWKCFYWKKNEAREVSFIPRARTEFAFENFFFLNVTKTCLFFLFVRWKINTCRLAFFPRVRNKQLVIIDSYYVVKAKSFCIIINPFLTKLVRSRRLYISLVLFIVLWISTSSHSIETRKELSQYPTILTSAPLTLGQ